MPHRVGIQTGTLWEEGVSPMQELYHNICIPMLIMASGRLLPCNVGNLGQLDPHTLTHCLLPMPTYNTHTHTLHRMTLVLDREEVKTVHVLNNTLHLTHSDNNIGVFFHPHHFLPSFSKCWAIFTFISAADACSLSLSVN